MQQQLELFLELIDLAEQALLLGRQIADQTLARCNIVGKLVHFDRGCTVSGHSGPLFSSR